MFCWALAETPENETVLDGLLLLQICILSGTHLLLFVRKLLMN